MIPVTTLLSIRSSNRAERMLQVMHSVVLDRQVFSALVTTWCGGWNHNGLSALTSVCAPEASGGRAHCSGRTSAVLHHSETHTSARLSTSAWRLCIEYWCANVCQWLSRNCMFDSSCWNDTVGQKFKEMLVLERYGLSATKLNYTKTSQEYGIPRAFQPLDTL